MGPSKQSMEQLFDIACVLWKGWNEEEKHVKRWW